MGAEVESKKRVGVIGLGAMGSGIARTCLEAGYRVSIWNRSSDKAIPLVALGAIACDKPDEVLEANRHVVVCVADYAAWMQIVSNHGLEEHLVDTTIIQLTGGSIDDVTEHEAFIAESGGRMADGALMCFPSQLGTSESSILVAGAPDVLEDCDPLLRVLDPDWTNLGEDITKPAVLSRALTAGILSSFVGYVNGLAICREAGIPIDVYINQSVKADAIVPGEKRRLAEAVRDGRTEHTEASIDTWVGAHQTIHAVAEALGTNLVLQDAVKSALQEARQMGYGEHDLAALVEVFAANQPRS